MTKPVETTPVGPAGGIAAQLAALARTPEATGRHDFAELLTLVAGESNFKAHAHNHATGATGPFQFVKSTWLSLLKTHGAALGLKPDLVANIVDNGKGRPTIGDQATLKQVLDLRNDVSLSARVAAKYLDDSKLALGRHLHREVSDSEIQMSFLLGTHGAAKLIKAAAATPELAAAAVLPHAAAHNRSLFYHPTGEARSAVETVHFLAARYHREKAQMAAYLKRIEVDPESGRRPGPGPRHRIEA